MAAEIGRSGLGGGAVTSRSGSRDGARRRTDRRIDVQPDLEHGCVPGRPNEQLVNRCLDGDLTSWRELVARYERLVYAIPLREGLSVDDAAEISQTTFETLVQSLHRIEHPERLGHWLMTVTRRLTWRRRQARESEITIGIEPAEPPTPASDDDWERAVDVYDAVAELGEPCRSLILGLFFDPTEPSYDDLARLLGLAVGSIGPLRGRCLARLRTVLEDDAA